METQLELLVEKLKENNQDFEFYPTTDEMLDVVFEWYNNNRSRVGSMLDIGCGSCKLYDYFKNNNEGRVPTYYVMEKSQILLNGLPKEAIVLGTDFEANSLLDKPVDMVFCNPPYSKYADWTIRIIRECTARHIFLVIPQRWAENADIQQALKDTHAIATSLGDFDFLNAERQARAKVNVVHINKEMRNKNYEFDLWFDSCFPMGENKETDYRQDENKKQALKNQLVNAPNKLEALLANYTTDLATLQYHFKTITDLDSEILESINVSKNAVKEALLNKIKGLKNRYWRVLFEELEQITSRLTSSTREKFYERYKGAFCADFNYDNVQALLIWICKNASAYYDEQLVEWYKTFTTPDNIIKYKSNQRVFKRSKWMKTRFDCPSEVSHYCLSYRIICDAKLFRPRYMFDNSIDEGMARVVVNDLAVLATNLGFSVGEREFPSEYGKKYYIYFTNGRPLIEFKVYQNGNTHLKLDREFCKAMNVEVARILGWIQQKEDVSKEFPDEMKGAEVYFGRNLVITHQNIKLLR